MSMDDADQSLWTHRERDACGIGFIAHLEGRRQRRVLDLALTALANLSHRGACGADAETSDGTGLLTQIPWRLLRRDKALSRRLAGRRDEDLALGCCFLPHEDDLRHRVSRDLVDRVCHTSGLEVLGWRRVPVRPEVLGPSGRATLPAIWQFVVVRPAEVAVGDAFERRLYLARRRIEKAFDLDPETFGATSAEAGPPEPTIVSLSCRTTVYKSMALASRLRQFYPDLGASDFETAVALFHQRFSTNTTPSWRLAQPFRMLAHNGEINTIQGNANWMRAREPDLASPLWGDAMEELLPVLDPRGSDSAMLDQMLELLTLSGRDPLHALAMLLPEAKRRGGGRDSELQAFYDYHATLVEPWDGPAAVVVSDGRLAAAALDRNGLRPQRFWRTADGLVILGSEAGMAPVPDEQVVERGRLGPGQMLAVDMEHGCLLRNDEIKRSLARRRAYRRWLDDHLVVPPEAPLLLPPRNGAHHRPDDRLVPELEPEQLEQNQRVFGYSREALERIVDEMARHGKPPVGSMGNDAPLAVLSEKPQLLYSYFKQRFAQVTNPPVDPIRERLVFDLDTFVGGWRNLLGEDPAACHLLRFRWPILTSPELAWLRQLDDTDFYCVELATRWPVVEGVEGLRHAVESLTRRAEEAADAGASLLLLSDRGIDADHAPIPMLLATAAVHQHLVRTQKRMRVSIVCDTGEPREDHHFACLIAYGATLVHPYLVYETLVERSTELSLEPSVAVGNYLRALEQGLLKILSRLGVAPMASYHGAQLFEALGLDRDLVERHFTGTPSRVDGVGLKVLAADALAFHHEAFGPAAEGALVDRGFFRYRKGGEHHDLNPLVFKSLHKAVREESAEAFEEYSRAVDEGKPSRLRDLLAWRRADEPLALDEVEPAATIVERFATAAMSLGALSREAHEVLAVGMNRLGARSNSGEGGEDPRRFEPYGDTEAAGGDYLGGWQPGAGDWGRSAIKQIASGRFGVTPHYLVSARELEIKMAQGSKPGEGGQIPAHKVTAEIARLRRSVPGIPLVSPPPHHDIYSIEDLAQLIHDLRAVHPAARIGVKLVSLAGVGTIAAGVVKAGADYVLISGDDGGTGASPLSSIKHAGMPWELGLAEAQQVLVRQGLRERVALRVDGGLKTGRDVVLAALLGGEEFAFGTAPLVAIGCVMARRCHLDTCPVGIATQRPGLRAKFPGTPEHVVSFMLFVAEQVRHILARMGFRRLDEIIGRLDLLEAREDRSPVRGLDLARLLTDPDPTGERPRRRLWSNNASGHLDTSEAVESLGQQMARDGIAALERDEDFTLLRFPVSNRDRSLGTRLSGEVVRRTQGAGLAEGRLKIELEGAAGQSLGAFLCAGLELRLWGEAQDGVGKGMAGGRIVLRPQHTVGPGQTIAGNTLLYGATGGELFAAGQVGERFCVRNSGARAVVEGCGDHGCEYMTAGVAVVLGATGENFGAGMSGGRAYLLDPEGEARDRLADESLELAAVTEPSELAELHDLVACHAERTGSPLAQRLLADWSAAMRDFVRVEAKGTIVVPPDEMPEAKIKAGRVAAPC